MIQTKKGKETTQKEEVNAEAHIKEHSEVERKLIIGPNRDEYQKKKAEERKYEKGKTRTWKRVHRMLDSKNMREDYDSKIKETAGMKHSRGVVEEGSHKKKLVVVDEQNLPKAVEAAKQPR